MPPRNITEYTLAELRAKLLQINQIAGDMKEAIDMAEKRELDSLSVTHADQFHRAIKYFLNFATATRKAVLDKPPVDPPQ